MRTLLKCVNSAATKTEEFDFDQTCSEAVSSITDDVCRPLRTRVEQILLLEAGPVVLYKLVQLIRNRLSLPSYLSSPKKIHCSVGRAFSYKLLVASLTTG